MLKFITSIFKNDSDDQPEGTVYIVEVEDHPERNLPYSFKKDAVLYKQSLKKSQRKLQGHIMRTEFTDGLITECKEVF